MPRLPIDYSNTIIYKIVCRDLGITNCYVGHTTNFVKRKACHKSSCKTEKQYIYQFIRENGEWQNWDMIMVEQYPCNNLYEASARERHWIETQNADLNQCSPPTGLAKIEYKKQYYTENAEKHKEHNKQYYTENVENLKQYYADNKEKISEYKRQYYADNKEKILEYRKQHICCIKCKTELSFSSLIKHYKSKH